MINGWYFYTAIIGFTFGIFISSVYTLDLAWIVYVGLIAIVVGIIARRGSKASSSGNLFLVSLFFFAVAFGMLRFGYATVGQHNLAYESLVNSTVSLEGVVIREPDLRERSMHLYVQVDDELLLVKTNRYSNVAYGDYISFEGKLKKPELFTTDLGRVFDYPKYLRARGVEYVVPFADVSVLSHGHGNMFLAPLLRFKQAFIRRIEQIIPEPAVGLAEGLLLGVKQALGEDLESIFRRTGIIHIVVLSGYNITIVVLFITYTLSYFLPFRFRLAFGLLAIMSFALMVGLSSTVVRASIMASLLLLAQNQGRTYAVIRALFFAGAIMLLINPYLLVYDIGFELSFLATLGLLLFAPFIEKIAGFVPVVFHVREFFSATVATQLFVLPILLYNIGEFSIVAVLVNVLVLPMVPVAMLLTFFTGMISFIYQPLATLLGYATYFSLQYIIDVASIFAELPFASVAIKSFSFYMVIISYIGIMLFLYYLHDKKNKQNKTLSAVNIDLSNLNNWFFEEEKDVVKRLKGIT